LDDGDGPGAKNKKRTRCGSLGNGKKGNPRDGSNMKVGEKKVKRTKEKGGGFRNTSLKHPEGRKTSIPF